MMKINKQINHEKMYEIVNNSLESTIECFLSNDRSWIDSMVEYEYYFDEYVSLIEIIEEVEDDLKRSLNNSEKRGIKEFGNNRREDFFDFDFEDFKNGYYDMIEEEEGYDE